MKDIITQEFVDNLYSPLSSGIEILKQNIDLHTLDDINKFIHIHHHAFEVKREKFIENNQLVSLLYRGSFDTSALDNTIFIDIIQRYKTIREEINSYSAIPFEQGSSLEIKLIHYPLSILGVGNHKDLSSNLNIIVFFNLEGSTDIKTYSDKQCHDPVSHYITQGDISIMRGPRSKNEPDIRPYHGVEEVMEPRTVLVVREINEELEKITNQNNWRGF